MSNNYNIVNLELVYTKHIVPLLSVYDKSKIQDSFQELAVLLESLFQLPLQTYNCKNHFTFPYTILSVI